MHEAIRDADAQRQSVAPQHTLSVGWRGRWGVKAEEPPCPGTVPPSSTAGGELDVAPDSPALEVGGWAPPAPGRVVGGRTAIAPGLVMPANACSARACSSNRAVSACQLDVPRTLEYKAQYESVVFENCPSLCYPQGWYSSIHSHRDCRGLQVLSVHLCCERS